MKAAVYERYGSTEVLELRDVPTPTPGARQVLIRVAAASVNASDWETLRGKPLYTRVNGLFRPKHPILGSDVAGRVEAVGSAVEQFQPGDEVFGDVMYHGAGAFAEYVCVSEGAPLIHKPSGMSFVEAAAVPQAAALAIQGLGGADAVQAGDAVLVNGAGGGGGSFAVQLAASAGAEVTAVDNELKLDLLRSLGAAHVVDYTRQNVTRLGGAYDMILDVAGNRSFRAYRRILKRGGRYGVVGGSMRAIIQAAALGPLVSKLSGRRMGLVIVKPGKELLTEAVELIERGVMKPVIDRTYPLEEVPAAIRHLGERRALGKVVVTVAGVVS